MMNKVDGKLTKYQIGLVSFAMAKKLKNDRSFSDNLLPLLEIYFSFDSTQFDVFTGFFLMKINDNRNDQNKCVMRIISFMVLIRSKIFYS